MKLVRTGVLEGAGLVPLLERTGLDAPDLQLIRQIIDACDLVLFS